LDALLNEYEATYKAGELRAIARCFMSYDLGKTTKAGAIKAVRNWQREAEPSCCVEKIRILKPLLQEDRGLSRPTLVLSLVSINPVGPQHGNVRGMRPER
jgi:hypothetical protein